MSEQISSGIDFNRMHRAMSKRLPGFQGIKYGLRSTQRAKREVGSNLALLKNSDYSIKEAVILEYIYSKVGDDKRDDKRFREENRTALIGWTREQGLVKDKHRRAIDAKIRKMEEELRSP